MNIEKRNLLKSKISRIPLGFSNFPLGNKKIMYVIFVIGLILLVGCAKEEVGISRTTPFVGGSKSLDINFVAGEPPEEALDQDQLPFVVTVSIENEGEWNVAKEDVTIKLRGFRPADFNSPTIVRNPDEDLSKTFVDTDGNVIPGTFTHVTFEGFSYTDALQANNVFPIVADICYKYGTEAQLDVCYLEDLTEDVKRENVVCRVRGAKTSYSSSAPVSVENVNEELAGTNKIAITFDVVNRGNGLLSKLDTDCNEEDKHTNKNTVLVEVDSGLDGLSCSGLGDGATSGYVTLNSGKRNIRCTQEVLGDGDYVKKAHITLKYDYKEITKTTILIKHVTD